MACNITGQVVIPDGSSAANRQITLRKEDFTLSAQGSLSILPEEIVVYTDALGNVDFDLVAGTYSGYYVSSPDGRAPFRLRVPDGATTANFADLIVVTSVTYDPALTQLVLDAKTAIENGGSGGGGTNAVWGSITGTLSNQLDLNTALAGKASTSSLNLKANVTDVTNGLALKADTTYVDTALAGKANTSDLTLKANVTDVLAGLATKSDVGHTHTFASLTEKPTDISGYGITDGVTIHSTQTVTGKKHFSQPVVLVGTATDPASVEDGGLWYNSTDLHVKTKISGSLIELDSPLWSRVAGKPTTLTGFGITDAYLGLARNPRSLWLWNGHGSSTLTAIAAPGLATVGTLTTTNPVADTAYNKIPKAEYLVTTAATTAVAGFRCNGSGFATVGGASAGLGGFEFFGIWGPATGLSNTTHRAFFGMGNLSTPTDLAPSSDTNFVGMGWDDTDTNIQLICRGTGSVTKLNLGASWPHPTTDRTAMYSLRMYSPPGPVQSVECTVTDLISGATVTVNLTGNLPGTSTRTSPKAWCSVGGTSSVVGIAVTAIEVKTMGI